MSIDPSEYDMDEQEAKEILKRHANAQSGDEQSKPTSANSGMSTEEMILCTIIVGLVYLASHLSGLVGF